MVPALRLPLAALALLAPAVLAAQAPSPPATLGEWLARDRAVPALPEGGLRSAELAALHRAVVDGLNAARTAAPPGACLPPPGTTALTSAEIGTWLQSRPAREHGDRMDQVLARFLSERFACP